MGFCSYRELWGEHKDLKNRHSKPSLLKKLPSEWSKYEAIIGEPTTLNRPKWIKLLKHGKLAMLKNYREIFKPRFSIKFQFDMYHGIGNLDKAIELLPEKDKQDFSDYVRKNRVWSR